MTHRTGRANRRPTLTCLQTQLLMEKASVAAVPNHSIQPLLGSVLPHPSLTLYVDSNLYVTDYGRGARIREVTPSGIISTVAGSDHEGYAGDRGPATSEVSAS